MQIRVKKVYNPQLYGMFLLSKEELEHDTSNTTAVVDTVMLYHATSDRNSYSIALNNIDWRRTIHGRYGIGACFTPCPKHAHKYASFKESEY